ncbi:MAG: hypothetical protein RLP44_20470 [Aggregatilineales bacterium]
MDHEDNLLLVAKQKELSCKEIQPHYQRIFSKIASVKFTDVSVAGEWTEEIEEYEESVVGIKTKDEGVIDWIKELLQDDIGIGQFWFSYFDNDSAIPTSSYGYRVSAKIVVQDYEWIDLFWKLGGFLMFEAVDIPVSWALRIDRGNPWSEYKVTAIKYELKSLTNQG